MSEVMKCKASVWKPDRTFRGGHSVQCTRAAKVDGFCTQHHPDAIKARDLKSRQEYEAKWAADRARRAVEQAAPDLLAALKGLLCAALSEHVTCDCKDLSVCRPALDAARAAIAKAEGK